MTTEDNLHQKQLSWIVAIDMDSSQTIIEESQATQSTVASALSTVPQY